MKVVPLILDLVRILSGVPSLDNCASTVSNESSDSKITGLISTVQMRVMFDPTGQILLTIGLVVIVIDDGGGTVKKLMQLITTTVLARV